MATRQRRVDRGIELADGLRIRTGAEVRLARRSGGVSLRAAAASVGLSETMFGRLERGQLPNVTVRQLCLACAAVGLKPPTRPYPDGDPVRDAGHARLLERFHRLLPGGVPWRTEVPIPIAGDPRA